MSDFINAQLKPDMVINKASEFTVDLWGLTPALAFMDTGTVYFMLSPPADQNMGVNLAQSAQSAEFILTSVFQKSLFFMEV